MIAEEVAKTLLAIGITVLLIPSDPSDLATTGPLLLKLQKLIKSSRLFKLFSRTKVKPKKLDDFDELIPGVDIPGISEKGIRIRAQALLKKLNPNIKFDNIPKKEPSLKQLLKKEKELQEKLYQIIRNASPEKAMEIFQKFIKKGDLKVPRNILKKGDVKVNPKRQFLSGSPDMTGTNSNPLGGGGTPLSMNESPNNDIALAPINNIFLINQENSTSSTPTTQGGSTILIGKGTMNSFDAEINIRQMEILQTA